jgi:hypothetical protein
MTKTEHSTAPAGFPAVPQISDLLRRTIERHEAAYNYFSSAVYLSDSGILGREATVEEEAIYRAASDAESEALSDLCYFPARTAADVAAKARHLRKYHCQRTNYLEDWQVENLLRSMLPQDERDQLDDGEDSKGDDIGGLIAAHMKATALVNAYEGGYDDDQIGERCDRQSELAIKILGYRPQSEEQARRKVEFLHEWTADTQLTAEEQNALVASMLPEGGAA